MVIRLVFKKPNIFQKPNIHRDKFPLCRWIIALIPFLCGRIAQKFTLSGFGIKFGSIFVWEMDKYNTTKDFGGKRTKAIYVR